MPVWCYFCKKRLIDKAIIEDYTTYSNSFASWDVNFDAQYQELP